MRRELVKGKIVRTKILVLMLLAIAVVFLVLQRAENEPPFKSVGVVTSASMSQANKSSPVGERGRRGRRAKKCGGNEMPERVETLGLKWLADNQLPEGNWDNMKWGECYYSEAGITGLALLAFAQTGHTERFGKYRRVVQKAMKWLANHQDASGNLAPGDNIENHAIAALALLEEVAMAPVPSTKEICKKGIDYLLSIQNKNSGWGVKADDKDSDLITTTWCVIAMKAAMLSRFDLPAIAWKGVGNFVDSVSDPVTGRVGRFERPLRSEKFKVEEETLYPACAVLCKLLQGVSRDNPFLRTQYDLFEMNLPQLNYPSIGNKYFMYWFFGRVVTIRFSENWAKWNESTIKMLEGNNNKIKGNLFGSWDPAKKAILKRTNGRLYSTAMSLLSCNFTVHYYFLSETKTLKK